MIANSGHDERGKYTGGSAGDQTGTEWEIRNWYNYSNGGWNCVLRYPDEKVGAKIAELARAAANNNNIGYDQWQRLTFWYALEKVGYDPSKITSKVESDCSSGVTAIIKAVGYLLNIPKLKELSITNYTGSMKANFRAVGFEVLTNSKYLTSDKYLLPGDILLNEKHHTCINLDYGHNVKPKTKDEWIQDDDTDRWWYKYADGTCPKSGWKQIDGKWYCFDDDGWLLTNQYIKSKDYDTNGKIYYVDKSGVWDGETYKWEKDKKGWWLARVGSNDYLKDTWAYIDGKWYYFQPNGYIVKNQGYPINGVTYQFDKDGALIE